MGDLGTIFASVQFFFIPSGKIYGGEKCDENFFETFFKLMFFSFRTIIIFIYHLLEIFDSLSCASCSFSETIVVPESSSLMGAQIDRSIFCFCHTPAPQWMFFSNRQNFLHLTHILSTIQIFVAVYIFCHFLKKIEWLKKKLQMKLVECAVLWFQINISKRSKTYFNSIFKKNWKN